jgi:uncharacterized damage-inducible protein DinB
MRLVERMLLELNANFDGDAWHGTPLLRLLDGVDDAKAHARPIANGKTIAELVGHIIAWMGIVQRRAAGEQVDVTAEMDFPSVDGFRMADAIEQLQHAQTRLIDTVARLHDDDFDRIVAGKEYTVDYMLHGLISHNAYHGGQIALLKK